MDVVNAVRMHAEDTVAVVVKDVAAGERIVFAGCEKEAPIVAKESIPYGHKVAIRPVRVNEPVIKYGEKMGVATADIEVGRHVHVHNVRGLRPEERGVNLRGYI